MDIEIHQEKSETAWRKSRAAFPDSGTWIFEFTSAEQTCLLIPNREPIEKKKRTGRGRNKSVVHDGNPVNWNPDALAVRSCSLKYGKNSSRSNTTLRLMGIINYRDWYVDPLFIPPSVPLSSLCLVHSRFNFHQFY